MSGAAFFYSATAPMTATAAAGDREIAGWRLWVASFAIILVLHAGVLALAMFWFPVQKDVPPPAALMMVELAPAAMQATSPLGRVPQALMPKPQKHEEKSYQNSIKNAEVKLPRVNQSTKKMVKNEGNVPQHESVGEYVSSPMPAGEPEGEARSVLSSVPTPAFHVLSENAMQTWQGRLIAHLMRYKYYPRNARIRQQEGVVTVHFTVGRDGGVLSANVARGSGYAILDGEGLALLERAQPLPLPPSDIGGSHVEVSIPIEFFLK